MRRLHAGTIGCDAPSVGTIPEVSEPWPQVLAAWQPGGLRSVQRAALIPLLGSSQHLVICAPTNSGKSICAHLELLRCCLAGQRAVLVEPMRVLAAEQAKSLEATIKLLSPLLGCSPTVRLSTGEFRHTDEFLSDPPPEEGEILVVTPERLDLILRNPENDTFMAGLGSVVVDEAHLLFDERRGPTLEGVLTSLLLLAEAAHRVPPRLVLLSATLPEPERVCHWLGARLVSTQDRYPSLTTWVEAANDQADANRRIAEECESVLLDPNAAVLIFVYRTRDAVALAHELGASLGPVGHAHSQMSSANKTRAIEAFAEGTTRVLVASSALAMGVNLPCTHVIVRDTHYPGVGPVPIHQLRQMCGRAGRGDRPGNGLVLVQGHDQRGSAGLATALSSLEQASGFRRRPTAHSTEAPVIADRIASLMLRFHDRGVDLEFLRQWYARSLGGVDWIEHIPAALDWMDWWKLTSTQHVDYHDGRWRLTLGGKAAATHGLPLRIAAGTLQLWRDLLELDDSDRLLADWKGLDHLILLELLADRSPSLRRDSADLAEGIDAWMERNAATSPSMLWREWLHLGDHRVEEVLGSLGIQGQNSKPITGDVANRFVRQALLRAIVLSERMRGTSAEQLARQWRLSSFDGLEEGLRDHRIWLSHGIAQLAEWPVLSWHCNHHLRIDDIRKERIKRALRGLRFHALSCCGSLSTCSPLGALLPGLRQQGGKARVGIGTLRTLEAAGVNTLGELLRKDEANLVAAGVRRDLAKQIVRYCRAILR